MKKYIFIAFLALLASSVSAQKLEKPIVDKITGETVLETKEEVLANPFTMVRHYLGNYISKSNAGYLFYFHLKEGGDQPFYVLKGSKAIIKLTDGKLIQLAAFANETYSSYKPVVTESTLAYDISDENVEILRSAKVAVVRIETSAGAFDYEIKDSKGDLIQKQLALFSKK